MKSVVDERDSKDLENLDIDLSNFKINPKPIIKEFSFPNNSSALIKNLLTKSVFESLLNKKTKLGGHLSHILNTALKIGYKEDIGLYLTDADVNYLNLLSKLGL